ncbi:MAG: prolyl oligopeptidase family serine peptidase, partial [Myxococcales bacterium]|nr:prolyl oligopeptidase family serine peptidase [Myxococcales bacterium]
ASAAPAVQAPTSPVGPSPSVGAPDPFAGMPPLVERELLFGDPEIDRGRLSPDGRFLSFRKPYRDVMNIWVKAIAEPFDKARPLTADSRPVTGYFWSEDSRRILYVQDKGGDENFHLYAVDPVAEPEEQSGVPVARDLTPYDGVRALLYAVPENTPDRVIVGLNDRDPAAHDVYALDLNTGKRRLLIKNDLNAVRFIVDLQGQVRLAIRLSQEGGTDILEVRNNRVGEKPVYSCTAEERCQPIRFHKDGRRVYLSTNGGQRDLVELVLWEPGTGKEESVDADPQGQVDFGGAFFSDATDELAFTYYVGDRLRVYPKTEAATQDWQRIAAALPDGDISFQSGTEDDSLILLSVGADIDPGASYLYDRTRGTVELVYRPLPKLPLERLSPTKAVRYTARDGLTIPGYLTVPKGLASSPKPAAVILPHGGPWSRDQWGYDPFVQLLANRGYVVLQPNFRGSAGYGKKFLNLGNKQWGTGTMQHDITDGAKWLAQQGIADPGRIAIMGGSYGGYATLAGVAFTPEVYAAGVDIVGPSSIKTLLETIPPYWAPIKKIFSVRVGDLDDPEDAARMRAQSPLHAAGNIRAPLLVIQGANDPRVKQSESDQIVSALRELGRPVEYLVAPDEGHGFRGEKNRLAMAVAIERFLAKHIGGRAQSGISDEVGKTLAAITVDVSQVGKGGAAAVAVPEGMPALSGAQVEPGEQTYVTKLMMGERTVEGVAKRKIVEASQGGKAVLRVEERVETSRGEGSDTIVLDASTLLPLSRSVKRGPVEIAVDLAPAKVSGQAVMMGSKVPIDKPLSAPVLMEGASLQLAVASLPLAVGYQAALRNFDLRSGELEGISLEVVAEEEITVPGGTFKAFRVLLKRGDDALPSTLWIETAAPRRVLKVEAQLPAQMGAGTATLELSQ